MVESKLTYEECRRRRVEENKKRMEELNLCNLAQALKPSTPVKQAKPRARLSVDPSSVSLRRSGRMADKPPPSYKDVPIEPLERIRRSSQRHDLLDRVRASDEIRLYAIERARKVESGLDSEFPSFIKPMLHSHVARGFWLGLPSLFCKEHLPLEDEMITLVDEEGYESEAKYLAVKNGLSGGWRGFAIDHDLSDGDALVFQLVKPTQFKVYIIRAHESTEDDNEKSIEKNDDINVTSSRKSSRKTRARKSDDNENEKGKEKIEDDDDDDEEEDDDDDDDDFAPPSSRSAKRTRASKN